MKNGFKILIISAIFFLFPFIIRGETKDFCPPSQGYADFYCKDAIMQCTYRNSNKNDLYIVAGYYNNKLVIRYTIDNRGAGKIDEKTGKSDNNINFNYGPKGKKIMDYIKNYECPPVAALLPEPKNDTLYVGDSIADIERDYKIAYGDPGDYEKYDSFRSQSINSNHANDFVEDEIEPYKNYPNASSCADFTGENAEKNCKNGWTSSGVKLGCVWNEKYKFCSPSGLTYISCGKNVESHKGETGNTQNSETSVYEIPSSVPILISYSILILKTATPVILIIMGIVQLIKSLSKQNEDEFKKARSSLIKKIIAAVLIFFTTTIVQFVITIAADNSDTNNLTACLDCFVNNSCEKSMYYTDGYGNCYKVSNPGEGMICPENDHDK